VSVIVVVISMARLVPNVHIVQPLCSVQDVTAQRRFNVQDQKSRTRKRERDFHVPEIPET
jgi:hypothetical protein